MRILALESSATACSAALCEGEKIIVQTVQNSGLTHSRTLMPMVQDMMRACDSCLEQVDVIAVATGPGSFTGLRIGVSTAKGLAWAGAKPCAPCSTLESMAWQMAHVDGVIVAVMDARRQQVYNALFRARNGVLERIAPDRAISLEELNEELDGLDGEKWLVGDGAQLCWDAWNGKLDGLCLAPVHLRWQTAWGVARAALELIAADALVSGEQLTPVYHRLSQAERERMAKEEAEKPTV